MSYSGYYHTGINPLYRDHHSPSGAYWVTHMVDGPWVYIMDDLGNAVAFRAIPYFPL